MEINKENFRRYLHRRIDKSEIQLDVGTLMNVFDFIREYKPRERK